MGAPKHTSDRQRFASCVRAATSAATCPHHGTVPNPSHTISNVLSRCNYQHTTDTKAKLKLTARICIYTVTGGKNGAPRAPPCHQTETFQATLLACTRVCAPWQYMHTDVACARCRAHVCVRVRARARAHPRGERGTRRGCAAVQVRLVKSMWQTESQPLSLLRLSTLGQTV